MAIHRPDDPHHLAVLADPARLASVAATGLLDAGSQASLERFTRLAANLVGAPISAVSLVLADREYHPAMHPGVEGDRYTEHSHAFCQHVVVDGPLEVEDASVHPVLSENGATRESGIRAYLGIPLVAADGQRLGAFCAADTTVREWTPEQRSILEDLAAAASTDLQLRLASATNAHQATHDALTGLGNRRRLMADLDAAVDADAAPQALGLFDLDGFKAYNDTFGHPAGDGLLRRIGTRLADEAAALGGTAYRMGGDEFCVIVPAGCDVEAIAGAIAERSGPFEITATCGAVALTPGAQDAPEVLAAADERLYARKHRRPDGSAEQAATALMQALAERSRDAAEHAVRVRESASAIAVQLGLDADAIADVRLAALLHDVGKVAIPESILEKTGPLDDDEWAFIRRHTLIGERILAPVPALAHVAGAVRSSHERHDGCGYPDGLAGDAVPLAARIIFVADSYDAMTVERPYREARAPEDALAELRACAGTQFDPGVVEAAVAVLARTRQPLAA